MNQAFQSHSAIFSALLLTSLGLGACSANRAYESSARETSPSAQPPLNEDTSAAGADGDAPGAPKKSEAPEDEGETMEEERERISADSEAPAPPGAEPAASENKEMSEMEQLSARLDALERSLDPKQLSCEGARPHQEAICAIAERICELEGPSTTKSSDCKSAEESCERAKKRFSQKCG